MSCDEDSRDEEAERYTSMAKGQFHEVTVDVTTRITISVPGAFHSPFDLEDVISDTDLDEGEITSVEEV